MFTGYGGLDMAVLAFYGGSLAWYAEVEPAACNVLAAHYPEVPNLGDVTRIDWTQVEPVDAITAGYPCQPFSHAGKRKGKNDERHLWPYVRDAIGALGPSHIVLENVAGHLSMGLADVIGDLAGLGYDARWGVVRAADAGAPHQRARVFIVANPNRAGWRQHGGTVADESEHSAAERAGHAYADAIGERYDRFGTGTPAKGPVSGWPDAEGFTCAPADSGGQRHGSGQGPRVVGRVGCTSEVSGWTASTARQEPGAGGVADAADANGAAGAQRDERASGIKPASRRMDPAGRDLCRIDWGQYEPAIRRWERLTRPAPAPTIAGANGKQRLSPSFVEWMMGLPEGHVTGHGLSNAQALKMLGNGVVPQQAYLALGMLA
jgi:DNA (cytosine-5)-methyltransferase 1